ncbi:hypothetical protein BJV77DRAFT_1014523 [Russula vinacea]|nr:hypothetical protein BJV77DRAFT_1014523 [Russula vinacea]
MQGPNTFRAYSSSSLPWPLGQGTSINHVLSHENASAEAPLPPEAQDFGRTTRRASIDADLPETVDEHSGNSARKRNWQRGDPPPRRLDNTEKCGSSKRQRSRRWGALPPSPIDSDNPEV